MKKLLLLFCLALFCSTAFAQLGVGVRLNRNHYMQYEPVFVYITIRNDSGRPLLFGKSPRLQGFLMFEVKDNRQRYVRKRKAKEISIDGLVLGPGQTKSFVIPLNEYYDIDKLGTYRFHAYVGHASLKHEYRSKEDFFHVEYGATVWKKTVGIPDLYSKVQTVSSERTYEVRIMQENQRKYYYLIVTDDKHVFGVTRIGHQVGREKFQVETDMLSRIHLLLPISSKVYHYLSFGVDGVNVSNSYWKTTSTIPQLYRNPESGVVTRIGGEEAIEGQDYTRIAKGKSTGTQLMMEEALNNAAIGASNNPVAPQGQREPFDLGRSLDKTVKSDHFQKKNE